MKAFLKPTKTTWFSFVVLFIVWLQLLITIESGGEMNIFDSFHDGLRRSYLSALYFIFLATSYWRLYRNWYDIGMWLAVPT